nr:unnamed protein product [Spirometra erinaceieuropaei]
MDFNMADGTFIIQVKSHGYLCPNSANIYGIEFTHFTLRDITSNSIIVDIAKPSTELGSFPNANGIVRYNFPASFLSLKTIGATHFFKDRLLKSFDFNFGFIIPGSKNTVEHIYEFPELNAADVQEMIYCPNETRSDSFYFVNDTLVMHNKAEYSYRE